MDFKSLDNGMIKLLDAYDLDLRKVTHDYYEKAKLTHNLDNSEAQNHTIICSLLVSCLQFLVEGYALTMNKDDFITHASYLFDAASQEIRERADELQEMMMLNKKNNP